LFLNFLTIILFRLYIFFIFNSGLESYDPFRLYIIYLFFIYPFYKGLCYFIFFTFYLLRFINLLFYFIICFIDIIRTFFIGIKSSWIWKTIYISICLTSNQYVIIIFFYFHFIIIYQLIVLNIMFFLFFVRIFYKLYNFLQFLKYKVVWLIFFSEWY